MLLLLNSAGMRRNVVTVVVYVLLVVPWFVLAVAVWAFMND